ELVVVEGAVLIEVELEADAALIGGIVGIAALHGDLGGSHGRVAAGGIGVIGLLILGHAGRKTEGKSRNGKRCNTNGQKLTKFHDIFSLSIFLVEPVVEVLKTLDVVVALAGAERAEESV